MNVYQISEQFAALKNLSDNDEIDEQTFNDTLNGITGEFESKCEAVALAIKNLEAKEAAIKDAAKSMASRANLARKNADRLRDFLLSSLQNASVKCVETPSIFVKTALNPPALTINNESHIPVGFYDPVPATKRLNKKRLKDALKDADIPGAHLEQKTRLVIK